MAGHLVDSVPAPLANQSANDEEQLRALQIAAGFQWNPEAIRAVRPRRLGDLFRRPV